MRNQNVLDLCSGGGGFLLAQAIASSGTAEFHTVVLCDNNDYCQELLSQRFPGIPLIKDIADVTVNTLRRLGVPRIDGICGGFPCQPHAAPGKKKASQDERDLWPDFRRIIREIQPRWAVFENVPGLLTSEGGEFYKRVLRDMDELGFDVAWGSVPCADLETGSSRGKEKRFRIGVGGVHIRERVWLVTYANDSSRQGWLGCEEQEKLVPTESDDSGHDAQPVLRGSHDGLPADLGGYLLRHDNLAAWLSASTMPSFTREPRSSIELTPEEVAALSPEDRKEYQQLKRAYYQEFDREAQRLEGESASEYRQLSKQFKQIRRQYSAVRGLMNDQLSVLGNAIVPQVGAIAFQVLKERLAQSSVMEESCS